MGVDCVLMVISLALMVFYWDLMVIQWNLLVISWGFMVILWVYLEEGTQQKSSGASTLPNKRTILVRYPF